MKMRQSGIFLLLIVIANIGLGSMNSGSMRRVMKSVPSPEDIGAMIEFTREAYEIFKDSENDMDIFTAFTDVAAFLLNGNDENSTEEIEQKLTDISMQFTEMTMKMDSELDTRKELIKSEISLDQFDLMRHQIAQGFLGVNNTLRDTFELLMGGMGESEQGMLAQEIIAGEENVQMSLWRIYHYADPEISMNTKTSFLDLMSQSVEDNKLELCGDGKSPNQYLYNLYKVLITTEIMGFMSLSYGYRKLNQLNGNIRNRLDSFERNVKDTEIRLQSYFNVFKRAIDLAPRDFRSCDPVSSRRNETFIEMERLYQSIMIDEISIQKGACKGTCNDVDSTDEQIMGTDCERLNDCRKVDTLIACKRSQTQVRRYIWVQDDNSHSYGGFERCDQRKAKLVRCDDEGLFGRELYECKTCICTCEANSIETMISPELRGVHVISLEAVRSSINNNMVITGLKFARQDGVILIQIKEGQLQSRGQIRPGSESWKNVFDAHVQVALSRVQKWNTEYLNEEKFVVIDEFHNGINLDDIVVPLGHVMTGIKFGISKKDNAANSKWKRLEIQVHYTPFNFTTGELLNRYEKSEWMSSETLHKEELVVNKNRDTPLNSKKQNLPNGYSNKFVKFVVSSFEKDLGQTTLPLLDAQPVESKPGSALAGVGLFHKGSPDFGGFLSFRLYSLNYAGYMKSNEIRQEQEPKFSFVSSSYVYYVSGTNKFSESIASILICIFVILHYRYST